MCFSTSNTKKLKAAKEKLEAAVKEGADVTDLKKEVDTLTKKSKELQEEEEQMNKKEKVTFTFILETSYLI